MPIDHEDTEPNRAFDLLLLIVGTAILVVMSFSFARGGHPWSAEHLRQSVNTAGAAR